MQLSEEHITKFQQLYKKRFGREITRELALEKGIKLVRLMSLIYQPMTEQNFLKLQERRKEIGIL